MDQDPRPGVALARTVRRYLATLDIDALPEFAPTVGRRVDLIGLTPKGEVWIVECKSSLADFRADHKWRDYLDWCDRFFWAVGADFPVDVLPAETGLIRTDGFETLTARAAPLTPLSAARRKALTLRLSRTAMRRHGALEDPMWMG